MSSACFRDELRKDLSSPSDNLVREIEGKMYEKVKIAEFTLDENLVLYIHKEVYDWWIEKLTEARVKEHKIRLVIVELAMLFKDYLDNNFFSFNGERIRLLVGNTKDTFCNLVKECPYFRRTKKGSIWTGSAEWTIVKLEGIIPYEASTKEPWLGDKPQRGRAWHLIKSYGAPVHILPSEQQYRIDRWQVAINKFGWDNLFDIHCQKYTPILNFLSRLYATRLVNVAAGHLAAFEQLFTCGIKALTRRKIRLYHGLTNLSKSIRRSFRIEWDGVAQRVAEVDMSSSYLTFLAGQFGKEKPCVGWEKEFAGLQGLIDGDVYEFVGKGVNVPDGVDRREYVKMEFQKQMFFCKDCRISSRPIFAFMSKLYPKFCRWIEKKRRSLKASGMSKFIMKLESSMFVDKILMALRALNVPAATIHDAIMVPESLADGVRKMLMVAMRHEYGLVPNIKVK